MRRISMLNVCVALLVAASASVSAQQTIEWPGRVPLRKAIANQQIKLAELGLVLPSLVLFVMLPVLLKRGVAFWPSLSVSVVAMLASYGAMVFGLGKFGIKL